MYIIGHIWTLWPSPTLQPGGLRCDLSLDSGDRPAPAELPRAHRQDLPGTMAERVGSVVD